MEYQKMYCAFETHSENLYQERLLLPFLKIWQKILNPFSHKHLKSEIQS